MEGHYPQKQNIEYIVDIGYIKEKRKNTEFS